MTKHFGRAAFFGAVASWAIVALSLAAGGLSPAVAQARILQGFRSGALFCAIVAAALAVFALVRGPNRGSAAIGLTLALLFLILFTFTGGIPVPVR